MTKFAGVFFFILFLVFACFAQPETVTFTGGTLTRNGYSHSPPPSGPLIYTFHFLGSNTDVNGGLYGTTGINYTEIGSSCCFYGKRLVLADFAEGLNNFQQLSNNPVVVNGTSYNPFYYRGLIRFNGSVLVPRYLKKKQTQVLRIPITSIGYIKGYLTAADRSADNPLFNTPLNMTGVATYTIRSHDEFMVDHFDIISVRYDLVP